MNNETESISTCLPSGCGMSVMNNVIWFVCQWVIFFILNDTGDADEIAVFNSVVPSVFSGFRSITWSRTLDRIHISGRFHGSVNFKSYLSILIYVLQRVKVWHDPCHQWVTTPDQLTCRYLWQFFLIVKIWMAVLMACEAWSHRVNGNRCKVCQTSHWIVNAYNVNKNVRIYISSE